MGSVFLTDAQQRKTLAAVRALARARVSPHVGEVTSCATSFFSRYCAGRLVYPSPSSNPDDWLDEVVRYIRRRGIECIFPMDDRCLELVSAHRELFEGTCAVPIPFDAVVAKAMDKAAAIEAAEAAGVRCPRTLSVDILEDSRGMEGGGVTKAPSRLWSGGYPAVVRPRRSSGARGLRVVRGPDELDRTVDLLVGRYPEGLIVQEYVPQGQKFDVCLLVDWSGEHVATFVQREIRHYPIPHGPSTLQESVWRPDLVDLALKVLESLEWRGLAEVEFMEDPRDGAPVFMEVNPRFWASLHLAVECGVDFPTLLYRLATGRPVHHVHEYAVGLRCRWLLPGDILHFLTNPNRWDMSPGFFDFSDGKTRDDILSLTDPGPAIGFGLACLRYVLDPEMWEFMLRR